MTAFLVLYDILFVLVFCLVYGAATFAGVGVVQGLGGSPFLAPVGVLAGLVTVIGVTSALHMLVPRPPNGAHAVGSPTFICWGLRFLIQRQLCLSPTRQLIHYSTLLRFFTYRSLGSRIAFNTAISSDAVILDWDRLRTGSGVVLGTEVRVYTHYLDRGKLILGDVHLGDGALLTALVCVGPFVRLGKGARVDPEARIGPRVTIEDGARVGPRAVIREDSIVRAGARVPEQSWIDKGSVIEATEPPRSTSSAAWSSAGALLLCMVTMAGCAPWAEPPALPAPEVPPTIAITSPATDSLVLTAADGDRTVPIAFDLTGIALKGPGTCLTTDGPCGHIRVLVDGDACNSAGGAFNSIATATPARASLGRCAVSAGSHTVRLVIARTNGAPWLDAAGAEISAEVRITAEIPPLIDRLGGADGIQALTAAMVARQLEDPNINAYFRNASIDHDNMALCMGEAFTVLATGIPMEDSDCESDLGESHAGLGVSRIDLDDWMANLDAAMGAQGIAPADAAEFVALVGPAGEQVVEDPTNDATLYQRLGRRPGLTAAVGVFVNHILGDPVVARYFLDADGLPDYSQTFSLCLVRMLGSLDGPFVYGEGFPLEPQLADEGRACRDMATSHQNLTSAPPDSSPITGVEFLQVAGILVDTLVYLQVPQSEIDLLVEAMNLPALCTAILADPSECATLFPPASTTR